MTIKFKRVEAGIYFSENARFLIEKTDYASYNEWCLTDLERWERPGGRRVLPVLRSHGFESLAEAKKHAEVWYDDDREWENSFFTPEAVVASIEADYSKRRAETAERARVERKRESGEWLHTVTRETNGSEWLEAESWERWNAAKKANGYGLGSKFDDELSGLFSLVAEKELSKGVLEETIAKAQEIIDHLDNIRRLSESALNAIERTEREG